MGKGYKHGGANPLNFTVKTYPSEVELKADKPKANTNGIITTTTMTSWVFSATEPKEPVVGMVWLFVGTSSITEFNAIKSKTLMVYPLSAKQYEGGKWVDKVAYSYQNGDWVEWATYLFNYGKQKYKWQARAWAAHNYTAKAPTVSVNSDGSVTLTMPKASSGYNSGVYELVEDFDLTNVDTLIAKGTGNGGSVIVVNRNISHWGYPNPVAANDFTNGECSLDTRNIAGSYDICIAFNSGTDADVSFNFKTLEAKEAM